MATTVLTDMTDRLRAAARDVADANAKRSAALELRNELVVAAIDGGMTLRAVARAAGVTSARVVGICATSQPDVDD